MDEEQKGRLTKHQQRMILAVLSLATFMTALDLTIVNIALPTIAKEFGVDIAITSWTVLLYAIFLSSFLLMWGRIGDIRSYKIVFTAGLITFTCGSLLCGLSSNIYELLAFRAFQGIGAGMIMSVNLGMASAFMPKGSRGSALAIMTMMASAATALGPVAGGMFTTYLSWHWIFYINIPVGIIAIVLGLRCIPMKNPVQIKQRLDIPGAAFLFVALFTLIYILNTAKDNTLFINVGVIAIAILFLVLSWWRERTARYPLIARDLIKNKDVIYANISGLLCFAIFSGSYFLLPFYLELVEGYTTMTSGVILVATSVGILISSLIVGRLSDRHGCRRYVILGCIILIIAMFLMSFFGVSTILPLILLVLFLLGIGVGTLMVPNSNQIFTHVVDEEQGVASGFINTFRNIGSAIGVAVMTAVFGLAAGTIVDVTDILIPYIRGFHAAAYVGMGMAVISLLFAFLAHDGKSGLGGREEMSR